MWNYDHPVCHGNMCALWQREERKIPLLSTAIKSFRVGDLIIIELARKVRDDMVNGKEGSSSPKHLCIGSDTDRGAPRGFLERGSPGWSSNCKILQPSEGFRIDTNPWIRSFKEHSSLGKHR